MALCVNNYMAPADRMRLLPAGVRLRTEEGPAKIFFIMMDMKAQERPAGVSPPSRCRHQCHRWTPAECRAAGCGRGAGAACLSGVMVGRDVSALSLTPLPCSSSSSFAILRSPACPLQW